MKDHVEIGHLTKYDAFRMNRDQVVDLEIWFKIHTYVSNFETASPWNHIKPLKLFMISVILFKMSKHSDFHLIFFQIEGAWQDFTVVTKLIKNFKSLYGFGGRFLKIRDVCMDFEPYFKVHNLVSVHPKSIMLGQMTNLNMKLALTRASSLMNFRTANSINISHDCWCKRIFFLSVTIEYFVILQTNIIFGIVLHFSRTSNAIKIV